MTTRVLIAGFKHETNTFSKLATDMAAYQARALHYGEAIRTAYAGSNTEIGGFLTACDQYGWAPVLSVVADATPSGKVSSDAYAQISGAILNAIESDHPVDAVLLQLHGAMVAEGRDDAQADLLTELRQRVGNVPIGVTLDLHANVSDRLAGLCDVMVSYRTYPHIDQRETAERCAALIAQTLSGEIRPAVSIARNPQLDGVDHGRTTSPGPMLEVIAQADVLCERNGFYSASVNAGFPWADCYDAGPSVLIVADKDNRHVSDALAQLTTSVWRSRQEITIKHCSASEALNQAVTARAAQTPAEEAAPFVIADFADNPGGGGYGDSTGLLRAMIDSDLGPSAFSAIFDPQSVQVCQQAGVGASVRLTLGGKCDPRFGQPIVADASVQSLHDGSLTLRGPMSTGVQLSLGNVAVVKIKSTLVVIVSNRAQNYDRQFFEAFGIDPSEQVVLGVKSAQHFRADYAPIASGTAVVDEGGGVCSHQISQLDYEAVRRPIWPLDDNASI